MIMRISILALLFCSQLLWAEAVTDRSWNFKVLINDREVGSHQFRVTGEGDSLSVSSTMSMDFKVLLVKKVRYQHQANETWQGSCLTDVSSQTNRQGKAVSLKVKPVETGLLVEKDQIDGRRRSLGRLRAQLCLLGPSAAAGRAPVKC